MASSLFHRTFAHRMTNDNKGDITAELLLLKSLEGAAFGAKLKEIAARKEFHALPDSPFIYAIGGGDQFSGEPDYPSLLMAAQKAVEHGYRVFILPNPHGVKTPDYILERRGIYKLFDLKNISGKNIVLTRLNESANQANRALLNMPAKYNTRMLAADIKNYFELNDKALEVLIFRRKLELSVFRRFAMSARFYTEFKKLYER